MNRSKSIDLSRFFVAGINYKKTNAQIRGNFAINKEQYELILAEACSSQIREFFVLSTCNRTEIYGFADDPLQLVDLLCSQTTGTISEFYELAYIRNDLDAIKHLFNVAAGLDSQILGDYEIVGQIKQAVRMSKEKGFLHVFLDRLINQVLQSSKQIKNKTALSDGTVSVSFAAVQMLKEKISDPSKARILVLGIGKMGRITCKNLKEYLQVEEITLMNRSDDKASELAEELGYDFAPFRELESRVRNADIIFVASNAAEPILLKKHLENQGNKLIIDLSIPYNVEKQAASLPGIELLTVDDLSKLKDETLQKREAEVPKVREIIHEHMEEFREWLDMRKHVVFLRAIKTKLKEIHNSPLFVDINPNKFASSPDDQIQRVINGMAPKIRKGNQPGCNYIEAINEYMSAGIN